MPTDRPTLLTFAPMVDSETARLALTYYRVSYRERDHLFGWVSLLAALHGGYGQVPLLYARGTRLSGPMAMVRHFDQALPPGRWLMPQEPALARQVEADWTTYNGGIGACTAVFAYFHLLPVRALMTPIFAEPVPPCEARWTPTVYPLLSTLFKVLLRLSPRRAEQAAGRIRAVFDQTDRRIADGRRYLCGDRMTLGDVALAGASAPLLLPPGYGAKMPALEEMPAPVSSLIRELRQHPTAGFVERFYQRHAPQS